MKKLLLTALAAVFSSVTVFALNPEDFSLTVEPVFGVKNGQLDEFVYEKNSDGDYKKESELNWPVENMLMLGLNFDGKYKKFTGKIHLSTLISGSSGTMEDSDWMGLTSTKTTYSKSENTLTGAFDFSATIGYEFQPHRTIILSPLAEYEYRYISFEGRNGYGWYGHYVTPYVSWDDPSAPYAPKGTLCGIDYTRKVSQFYTGIEVKYSPFSKLHFNTVFLISPFAYSTSFDTHYSDSQSTTGTDYADEVIFYFTRMKFSAGAYYSFNSRWEAGLNISVFYAPETTGPSYTKNHSSSGYKKTSAKGGAAAWEVSTAVSFRYKIF